MYIQAWKKYLPVIVILIKRSVNATQTLTMDSNDFVKASGGRKLKLGFAELQMNKGRINSDNKPSEVAKELGTLLQENDSIRSLLGTQVVGFSMSNDCTLTITNAAQLAAVPE